MEHTSLSSQLMLLAAAFFVNRRMMAKEPRARFFMFDQTKETLERPAKGRRVFKSVNFTEVVAEIRTSGLTSGSH